MNLPRYRCHKVVEACKIAAINPPERPTFTGVTCKGCFALGSACGHCERCTWEREHGADKRGAVIVPADPSIAPFAVSAAYIGRHVPREGGYYVRYADGYESFSPAQAFEEGYTRVEPNALELGAAVRRMGLAGR